MTERLVKIGVPSEALAGFRSDEGPKISPANACILDQAQDVVLAGLEKTGLVNVGDIVTISFCPDKNLTPESKIRPITIINVYGEGVEPDTYEGTIEVDDIISDN